MSFEDSESNQKEYSQNKSKPNGLIIGLIVAVGVAAFFAGMYFSNMNSNQSKAKHETVKQPSKTVLKSIENQA